MANTSIYNAFERMWAHVVDKVSTKAEKTYVDSQNTTTLNEAKGYTDEKVGLLMNNSSEAVDSVMELAAAMENNKDAIDALTEIAGKKVDKVDGKGLSTNDYTTEEKNKLAGIAAGAEVNVQSDWNATSGDAMILNKPELTKVVNVTIPAGRMRGDVNGDGIIDPADKALIWSSTYYNKGVESFADADGNIPMDAYAADVDGSGSINGGDVNAVWKDVINAGTYAAEITGNWTNNPNAKNEPVQFYTDIPVEGMTENMSATIIVNGAVYPGTFVSAQCIAGAIRLGVTLCPIEALSATVSYYPGDGSAVVVVSDIKLDNYISQSGGNVYGNLTFNDSEIRLISENKREGTLQSGTEYFMVAARKDLALYAGSGVVSLEDSSQLKNVLDPTDAQDAATKNYVDTSLANFTSGTQVQILTWEAND